MGNELIRILSEELRETKKMVAETRRMADAATKQAEAAWQLVIVTRNQVREEIAHLKLPWWKKVFGTTSQ